MAKADEAEISFALASALDATGNYEEAFRVLRRANAASRAGASPRPPRYDRAAQEALVDALIRTFPLRARPAARNAASPIFICGMFRSGSTLTEQTLARHSRVTAGGELETIPALVQMRLQPYPESLSSAPATLLDELRATYVSELHSLFPTADLVTDKRPDNFLHIGLIKTLFPEARIVHTRRNPLDNILSVYFLHFDASISYGLDLADIAHWYREYRRLMRHWHALYGSDIHDLDYDALVASPRRVLAELLDFCGLEWEDGCLSLDAKPGAVRTGSVWQVRQGIHGRSSGRWRHYERHLDAVRATLAESPT